MSAEEQVSSALATLKLRVRNLSQALRTVLQPITPVGGFHMAAGGDARDAMIDWLWAGNYEDSVCEMSDANPKLHARLVGNTRNSSYRPSAAQEWRSGRRLNYLTGLLTRNRSDELHTLVRRTRVSCERISYQFVSPSDGRQHAQRSQIIPKLLVCILVLRLTCEEHLILGHDVHIAVACQQAGEVVEPST